MPEKKNSHVIKICPLLGLKYAAHLSWMLISVKRNARLSDFCLTIVVVVQMAVSLCLKGNKERKAVQLEEGSICRNFDLNWVWCSGRYVFHNQP